MKPFSACVLWRVLFALLVLRAGTASAQKTAEYDPELHVSTQKTVVYYFASADELKNDLKVYQAIFQPAQTPEESQKEYRFEVGSQIVLLTVVTPDPQAPTPELSLQPLHFWRVAEVAKVCEKLKGMGWKVLEGPADTGAGVIAAVLEDQSKRNRIGVLHNPNYPLLETRNTPPQPQRPQRPQRRAKVR